MTRASHIFFSARRLPVALVFAACVSPVCSFAEESPRPEAQADAGVDGGEAPEAYRPFKRPEPLTQEPALRIRDLPRKGSCRQVGHADHEQERLRRLAALDAAMRRQGGMLLQLRPSEFFVAGGGQPGKILRGREGERLMLLGPWAACAPPPIFVITAKHEVFSPQVQIEGGRRRTIRACHPDCTWGCGAPMPARAALAEVPEGAAFVPPRLVRVPLPIEVVFKSRRRCVPKPSSPGSPLPFGGGSPPG